MTVQLGVVLFHQVFLLKTVECENRNPSCLKTLSVQIKIFLSPKLYPPKQCVVRKKVEYELVTVVTVDISLCSITTNFF